MYAENLEKYSQTINKILTTNKISINNMGIGDIFEYMKSIYKINYISITTGTSNDWKIKVLII